MIRFNCQSLYKIFITTLFCLPIHKSFAQGGHVGGGDGFSCFGDPGPGGLSDIDLDRKNLIPDKIFDFTEDGIVYTAILDFVKSNNPKLYEKLSEIKSRLAFNLVPQVQKIDTGAHAGFWMTFFGLCHRNQYAVQLFDKNVVLVKEKSYRKLHVLTQALLKTHELFVNLEYVPNESLDKIETRARMDLWKIINAPDFNRFVVQDVSQFAIGGHAPQQILLPWFNYLTSLRADTYHAELFIPSYSKLPESLFNESVARGVHFSEYLNRISWFQLIDAGFDINAKDEVGDPMIAKLCMQRITNRKALDRVEYAGLLPPHDYDHTLLVSRLIARLAYEKGLNLYESDAFQKPLLIKLFETDGIDFIDDLVYVTGDELTDTPLIRLNFNSGWCAPNKIPKTLLDEARDFKDNRAVEYLVKNGAKTAQELGLSCASE